MPRRIALTVMLLFLAGGLLEGAEQQWLQYRFSREPHRQGVSVSAAQADFDGAVGDDLERPDLAADDARLCRWQTPMAEAGFIWLAVDRSSGAGPYDTLYIDTDCDGSLADEEGVEPYNSDSQRAQFGPVKVVFQTEYGPAAVHVNVLCCDYPQYRRTYVSSAGWYEGTVTVGGEEYKCRLVDYNSNGAYNDSSMDFSDADQVWIGRGRDLSRSFVGRYVMVGGAYYHPAPAADGASIAFTCAENVPLGTLKFSEEVDLIAVGGINGLLTYQPEGGEVQVPAGKWRLERWRVTRKDERGATWRMSGEGFPEESAFEVAEGETVNLDVGEPVSATLNVSENSGAYYLRENLAGSSGERITLTRNGSRPPAPKLRITSEDGSYNRLYVFQHGCGGTCQLSWREPSNAQGPFTATIERDAPFEIKGEPRKL